MNNPVGIMQGRLSPPVSGRIQAFPWGTWEQEFFLARDVGLDLIDWIIEEGRLEENPLLTTTGSARIESLVAKTGVYIGAVCADYFMDCPLVRCSYPELKERLEVLEVIVARMARLRIKYLEVPFVDNSAILDYSELEQICGVIRPTLDRAGALGVTLALETSLACEQVATFLRRLNHRAARANYDIGNSAHLGFDPTRELAAYGQLVATVHVKDRVFGGGTVPLGKGDAQFAACFELFRAQGYTGPFILQVARGSDEVNWARHNLAFVRRYLGD